MVKLMHGDCLELMEGIRDKSIDLILCDLPYGVTRNKWDSVIPLDRLWNQYNRIIKDNGVICLFSQPPFSYVLGMGNLSNFKYEWVWKKDNVTGFLNANKAPLRIEERIMVFYKNQCTYNPQMRYGFSRYKTVHGVTGTNYGVQRPVERESNGERFPINILEFKRDSSKLHPTQKPVALLEYLINTYTNKNDLVLDNCMGSGSTGIACINTQRDFIGMELNDEYYQIAEQRILDTNRLGFIK